MANVSLLRLRAASPGESWQVVAHGSAALAWLETPFTTGRRMGGTIAISVKRPGGKKNICRFRWNLRSGNLLVERRWSGEFSAYISRKPNLTVMSHLRLAALAYGGVPPGTKPVRPGESVDLKGSGLQRGQRAKGNTFRAAYQLTFDETVKEVRNLIYASVERQPDSAALLLSGGLDSSIIAAVAHDLGKKTRAFVFSMKDRVKPQSALESDLACARAVAAYLKMPCTEILLDRRSVIQNVPLAVYLAETARGTIIDPCAAFIEVAKTVSSAGYSTVMMGESADDLFGSLNFALRYYQAGQLRRYYQRELEVGLPDELSVLQKVFAPWGISLVDPFWTSQLMAIGYNIPISYRVDSRRLMKRILREAFANLLPTEIVNRPKYVTRDSTQVRYVLEAEFGKSRERYRPIYKRYFSEGAAWRRKLPARKN